MTVTAALVQDFTAGAAMYLVMWRDGVVVASKSVNFGDYASQFIPVSVSPDGRYACCSNQFKTTVLDSVSGASVELPFTLRSQFYGLDGGYAYGPKFHPGGYIYDAGFDRRARLGVWAVEVLSALPDFGAPGYVDFDIAENRVWVSYHRPADDGALIRSYDLATRQEIALSGDLLDFARPHAGPADTYFGRVMSSTDGRYVQVYFTLFNDAGESHIRRIYDLLSGKVNYLPASNIGLGQPQLYDGYTFGADCFAYFQARYAGEVGGALSWEVLSNLLRLQSGASVQKGFGIRSSDTSPSNIFSWGVTDGQSFTAISTLFNTAAQAGKLARGVSLATGDVVPAPGCFIGDVYPPGSTGGGIKSAAGQPQYLPRVKDGLFWAGMRYAAEIA